MRQSKRNKSSFQSAPLLGAFLLLIGLSSAQTNQCNPAFTSTVYDGFLDTNVNYAQFSRDLNSSLRFKNPFQLVQPPPTQGSVMMWFRNQRTDGLYTQGRLFDCGDSLIARLVGTNLTVNITQNITFPNGTWSTNVTRQFLNTALNVSSQYLLASWNHLAVSVKNQRLKVFFNGRQVGDMGLNQTSFAAITDSCTIGNGLNVADPLNGQIRHLVFSNTGYSNTTQDMQSIMQIMRSVFLPYDLTVLAYFKFDKYSMFYDSYLYNTTRMVTATNVTLMNVSEPEQACYCPYQANPVLSVSQNSPLQPIPLIQNSSTSLNLDINGVTIKFWAYLRLNNRNDSLQVPDTVIVSLQNYSDIVVVNNKLTSMRVDLYTPSNGGSYQVTQNVLPGFSPVYNTWIQYEIQIGFSQVVLFVNGQQVSSIGNPIQLQQVSQANLNLAILPAYSLPTSVPGPNQISMLLTSISVYQNLQAEMFLPQPSTTAPLFLKIGQSLIPGYYPTLDPQILSTFYTPLAAFTFTLDQLQTQNQTQFLSSINSLQWVGNFSFEQINQDFCNSGEVYTYFDGISCQNTKLSANFYTPNPPTFISGPMRSFTPGNLSIDFWFKPNFDPFDPTLNQTGYLFQNFDQFNNPLVSISYGIYTGIVYCSLQNQTVQTDPTQIQVVSGSWFHVACVFNSVNGTVTIYSQQSNSSYTATAPMVGVYSAPFFANTQYLTYIGNNANGTAQAEALIKEVRVLNYSLAQAELNFLRFVKNNKQSLIDRGLLIGQIQLSTGYQGYYLNNSVDRSLFLMNSNPSGLGANWQAANDLTVCPPNTIFDGQCCNQYSPENLSVSILYNETQNVNVVLTAVVNNQPLPMQSMSIFNWTVTAVLSSNPMDFGTNIGRAILQSYINTNWQGQSQITIPYSLLTFAYNYQFTVAVDTIISSRPTAVLYNFSLPCPRGFILNMTNPIVQQAGFERNMLLSSQYFNSCYGQSGITVRSIRWFSNISTVSLLPNQSYVLYTSSPDNQTLNFTNNVPNNTFAQLNYQVIFSNNRTFNDSRAIQFLGQSIILNVANLSSDGKIYLPQGSDLIININSTQFLATTIGRNEYQFNITCPSTLTSQCGFNQQTGIFRVPYANLITPIPQFDYSFTITVGRNGSLRAVTSQTILVRWTNPPIAGQKCPGTLVNQANPNAGIIFRPNITSFLYAPYFEFDCFDNNGNPLPYRRLNISYTINNAQVQSFNAQNNYTINLSPNFNDTFMLLNNSLQFVFTNQSVTQRFRPGDIIPVNITMFLQRRDNPLLISTDTTLFNISIQNTPIQIVQNSNIQPNASGIIPIPFEQDFTMTAGQSFDPDYSNYAVTPNILNSSVLTYQYYCNGIPCVLDPSQIGNGSMRVTSLDRVRLNLPYNQVVVFQIIATNPLAPLKPSQTATFTTSIGNPLPGGLSQCPLPYFQVGNTATSNFYFTIANVRNLTLNLFTQVNCNPQQTYQFNYIMLQTFTPNLTSDGKVLYVYRNQNQGGSVILPSANLINQIQPNTAITLQATLLFNTTTRVNSTNATINNTFIRSGLNYSVALFTLTRSYANLVPQLRANYTAIQTQLPTSVYNVGVEENIFFDASLSYDPDNVPQPFTYQYTCSSNMDPNWCANIQSLTTFTLTKQQRLNMSLNSVSSQFSVSLTLIEQGRSSNIATITFNVVSQNYSRCFTVYDYMTQISVQSLSQLVNPIMIQPKFTYFCDVNNLIIDGFSWTSPQVSQPFWSSFSVPAGPNDFVIGVNAQGLAQFGQNSVVTLTAGANFVSFQPDGSNITTSFQNLITYQININNGPPSVVISAAYQLNLANGSPLNVSAYVVQNNQLIQQQSTCYYECLIAGNWIPNCANSTNCSFDIYPIASQYQAQLLTPGVTASVYAVVSGPSFSGSTRQALNFVYNVPQSQSGSRRRLQDASQSNDTMVISPGPSTNQSSDSSNNGTSNSTSNGTVTPSPPPVVATYPPLCQVIVNQNQYFLQDLQTVFNVFCYNYQSNQATYQWSINVITAGSGNTSTLQNPFTNGYNFQSIKVPPNIFVYSQQQYYQVSVIVTNITDPTQFATASMIVLGFNNLNINQGTITVYPLLASMVNAYMTQFQIAFSNQSDANMGVIFNTIAYSYQGVQTTLVTKTINQTFNVFLPANIDSIIVSTYDQQGAMVQTTIPVGIYAFDNSSNWTYDNYNAYLNSTIIPYLNWSSPYLVRFYPQDLEAATFALVTANNVLNNLQNSPNLGGISGFQQIIGAQAISYLWNYTNSSVQARRSVLSDSLLGNLQILNSCFSNALAQQAVVLVYAINMNDWASSINPNVYSPISLAYTQLLTQLYASTVLQANDLAYVGSILQVGQSIQISQMVVGDSLTLNSDGSVVTKINALQWPANQPIQTSNNNVQLTLNPSVLSLLPIIDGFLRIAAPQNVTQPPASSNLTLFSSVVDINFVDNQLSIVNISGIPLDANITFTPQQNSPSNNITCGYFNPSTGQWLLGSAGGLTTTYNQATNIVNCGTNHFSQFSIFNQTYIPPAPPTPPPTNSTTSTNNSYTQRLTVSLIELGIVVLALLSFMIQCCSESSRKAEYLSEGPAPVTESFTFGRVFCGYSPLFSLCSPAYRLPWIIRLFVLLNFLLYISLYTLGNLAILDSNYRTVGDIVWLIASIVVTFLFAAPRLNHIFIYIHLNFPKAPVFSNIGEAKSFETHRDERQPIADAPMTPTAGNTPNFKLKPENHFEEDHGTHKPEQIDLKAGQGVQKKNEEEDAVESNKLKHGLKEYAEIRDKQLVKASTGDDDIHILGGEQERKPVMSPHAGVNVGRQTEKDYAYESDSSINNSDGHTVKNISNYNQNQNKSALKLQKGREHGQTDSDHYEGGEREDEQSPNPKQQRNRRDRYAVEEPDTANGRVGRRDGPSEQKRMESSTEIVEANLTAISVLQLLALFVGIGLNAFLFSWVGINNVVQINAYFASLVISAALIIIVLDFLISFIAYSLFKSKGHKSSNCLNMLFVYGFIGLNRIRCLQQE